MMMTNREKIVSINLFATKNYASFIFIILKINCFLTTFKHFRSTKIFADKNCMKKVVLLVRYKVSNIFAILSSP